ncbi:hypothetical protein [Photorhabdus sp. SF281]
MSLYLIRHEAILLTILGGQKRALESVLTKAITFERTLVWPAPVSDL